MTTHLPPAVFLMGPTAAGKTDLAVELVQQRNCEIISVDSALIYCSMDIGSAKPDVIDPGREGRHRKKLDRAKICERFHQGQTDPHNDRRTCLRQGHFPEGLLWRTTQHPASF